MDYDMIKKYELNNRPVWRGYLDKVQGEPLNKPTDFVIRMLVPNDIDAMGNLSEAVYQSLGAGEECFIHKHNKSYYTQVFRDTSLCYIGVFAHGKLVGMSYLRVCKTQEDFLSEIPGSPENVIPVSEKNPVATFGADSILPAYRGNRLNQIMVHFRLELAKRLGCSYATSIIDRQNHWNMPPYFQNGFYMYASAIDPSDSGKIALMACPIEKNSHHEAKVGVSVPYNRMRLIDAALKKGFTGVEYDSNRREILFQTSRGNFANLIKSSRFYRSMFYRLKERVHLYV